jgi:hypothetical protein
MKTGDKKQLVMIGIRRRGESGFKLKMIKREQESAKPELSVQTILRPSRSAAFA